jgi:transmembrane sensor
MPHEEIQSASGSCDAIAVQWVARTDRGPLTPEDAAALEQWLAQSPRHRGAFARAQAALAYFNADLVEAIADATDDGAPALRQRHPPFEPAPAMFSRRRLLWLGGGAAGAAAAAVGAFIRRAAPQAVSYTAQRGEIRLVPLSDGSLITLDTASTVAVQYARGARNIELRAGRALFDVAKDRTRPFIVTAGGLRVQAVGTSFVVRKPGSHPPEVLVREGIVDVGHHGGSAPIRVGANMRVVASANAGPALNVMSVDPAAVSRELAWRQGMLAFEDASLATVAEEFARYSETHIVIPDPKVAAERITGVFAANNPLGFARAAALSLGLKLDVETQKITLRRS